MHILSGRSLGNDRRQEQLSVLESNLRWASEKLQSYGIIGLLEPINTYSKPGYFLNNYNDGKIF